ncbi:MAG: DUF3307 domain-containing protein [Reichenbachiella sp.]|uniref:DUF3307 domain-containing protein n=1 Tax=Reichenbachiella sp. TaxID=2184521 RepID=UPI002965DE32|nr:DUF3307 domain-containing protein [Reichenbachiella sp.]MDW3210883.1 DUF3307 domain-containing protein [Reichenbachiella sp.]
MIALTLKLLLAHLIGDFLIQPTHWIKDKEEKKHKSKYLYVHLLTHTLAILLLLQFDFSFWKGLAIIIASHFIIDLMKINFQNSSNKRWLFFLDQLAHLFVLAWVVNLYEPYSLIQAGSFLMSNQIILFVIALLTTTVVSSIFMKVIITKWELEEDINSASLEHAGKYIGMLERLFIFGFIALGQWQSIGFLLAAKSVFRFGDLSKAKDRKLTEYILIGTLLSFGFAILCGLAYVYFSGIIDR